MNKIEEIMGNYKKEVEKIDKKYDVEPLNKPDTKELDDKITYEKELIAKLEFEGEKINSEMIERAKQRLKSAMDQKAELDLNYEKDLLERDAKVAENNKLKNSKVVLESGREVSMKEKDDLDKEDLRNKAIKELTSESKAISEKLATKKVDLENKRKEWQEFKYIFEKDENGNSVAINEDEVKKIHAEFNEISKEIEELDKMKVQCDGFLTELKSPRKKDEDLVQAWKKVWEEENKSEEEKQEIKQKGDNIQQEKDTDNKNYRNIHFGGKTKNNIIEAVSAITINEKAGEIYVVTKEGRETKLSLEEALQEKKDIYKTLNIKEVCNEIAGGKIKGLLLGTKVNPAIVYALQENPDMVKTYIECLKEEKELPFELTHDLRESKLGFLNKMKMWIHAKAEDKIPGTKVNFATRIWNKNRTLPFPTKLTTVPEKDAEKKNIKHEYKVNNKDNKIEKVASKIMKETEEELANDVKNMTEEENEVSK